MVKKDQKPPLVTQTSSSPAAAPSTSPHMTTQSMPAKLVRGPVEHPPADTQQPSPSVQSQTRSTPGNATATATVTVVQEERQRGGADTQPRLEDMRIALVSAKIDGQMMMIFPAGVVPDNVEVIPEEGGMYVFMDEAGRANYATNTKELVGMIQFAHEKHEGHINALQSQVDAEKRRADEAEARATTEACRADEAIRERQEVEDRLHGEIAHKDKQLAQKDVEMRLQSELDAEKQRADQAATEIAERDRRIAHRDVEIGRKLNEIADLVHQLNETRHERDEMRQELLVVQQQLAELRLQQQRQAIQAGVSLPTTQPILGLQV